MIKILYAERSILILDMDGRISFQEFKRSMFAVDFEQVLSIAV